MITQCHCFLAVESIYCDENAVKYTPRYIYLYIYIYKQEEQEELLIDLISKVENPELKFEYLKKLRKVIGQESPSKSTPQSISLNTTLEKFSRKKEVTLQDLQLEAKLVKKRNS